MVPFTGSEEGEEAFLEQTSRSRVIKNSCLELGGKGPLIAHKDCDISGAVNSTIRGFCLNQGGMLRFYAADRPCEDITTKYGAYGKPFGIF